MNRGRDGTVMGHQLRISCPFSFLLSYPVVYCILFFSGIVVLYFAIVFDNLSRCSIFMSFFIRGIRGVQKIDRTKPNQLNQSKPSQTNFKPIIIDLIWFESFKFLIGLVWFVFDLVNKSNQTNLYIHMCLKLYYVCVGFFFLFLLRSCDIELEVNKLCYLLIMCWIFWDGFGGTSSADQLC